ncbi:MAG: OmpA family protein [Byssovorax sp.]
MAFLAAACLAFFPACSDGNLASKLATPPEFAPKDQSKCGVTKSQAEPLIVEWPDAARGRLEALLRRGVVAVHYSGCEMEVLGQCSAKGHYGYASFTPKKSNVKMRDADELYANIPAYAAKFEAALQKAGELNVSMTIVGRYEADRAGVRADDLEGQCAGATHFVNALTVGSFDFFAGADASIGAGVAAGNAGAGAKSSSKRESLNQDGDAAACANSKRDDKEPPFGCGALIRVEVIPIIGARPAAVAHHDEPTPTVDAPSPPEPTAPTASHDRDGDGVLDNDDACPDQPGPASSKPSESGCPAAPKKVVVVTGTSMHINEVIHFATGTAKIAPESTGSLDSVAQVMKSHPEITRLRIEAHTDNKGPESFAMKLTQERAETVKKALVSRGVAESRLTATGYGAGKPIDTNDTDSGRARNRRVEFHVEQ